MQDIKEIKSWSADSVRRVCIENDLFTCGDNDEYSHMLEWVERLYPNTENIHYIAKIILRNSKDQAIGNVMYLLANKAVVTTYEIDEE